MVSWLSIQQPRTITSCLVHSLFFISWLGQPLFTTTMVTYTILVNYIKTVKKVRHRCNVKHRQIYKYKHTEWSEAQPRPRRASPATNVHQKHYEVRHTPDPDVLQQPPTYIRNIMIMFLLSFMTFLQILKSLFSFCSLHISVMNIKYTNCIILHILVHVLYFSVVDPLERRGFIVPHRMIWCWCTGHRWVGCHIWYNEEGTGWGHSPPRPLLAQAPPRTGPSSLYQM